MYKHKNLFYLYIIFVSFLPSISIAENGENGFSVISNDTGISQNSLYDKSWAVIIGINEYKHWPKLVYAVNDAVDIEAILKEMGFQTKAFIDEEATKTNIMGFLMNELPTEVGKNDRLFFFFSGHGHTKTFKTGRKKGYIIPVEGKTDLPYSNISMDELYDVTGRINTKHTYLVIDACFSGSLITLASETRSKDSKIEFTSSGYTKKLSEKRAVQILTAGDENQQVTEINGHGVFTKEFINALKGGADQDNDNYISGQQIAHFVRHQVVIKSKNRQTPVYGEISSQGGDMMFTLSTSVDSNHMKANVGLWQEIDTAKTMISYNTSESRTKGLKIIIPNFPHSPEEEDNQSVVNDYKKAKIEMWQKTDMGKIIKIYSDFSKKHSNATAYIRRLDKDRKHRFKEIQEGNQILSLIKKATDFNQTGEIMSKYSVFIETYPESGFVKKINDEIDLMSDRFVSVDKIESRIKSIECIKNVKYVKNDILDFKVKYPRNENNFFALMEAWKMKKRKLENKEQKEISSAIEQINRAGTIRDIETIKEDFTDNDCYKDHWNSKLEEIAQVKIKVLDSTAKQAFVIAKRKLENAKNISELQTTYMDFREKFSDSEHLITLDDLTGLKVAEIKMSNARTVEAANNILAEFIDILQLNEHKEILKETAGKEIARIRQEEEASLLLSKITEAIYRTVEAKDLCELKQIEEDTQKYIQDYPDSKHVSALKIQINNKRKELEEENQADMEVAKKEIGKEWYTKNVHTVTSLFDKKHPCSKHSVEIKEYAESRVETINKIATKHKSILTGISEAQYLKLLVPIENNIDTFTQRYEGYPYTLELSDKLQEKRNELILREEQAFEYAKIDLEDTKMAREVHLVYKKFKESFPDSEHLITLEDLTRLKEAEIKISNAGTVEAANNILAEFIDTLQLNEHKEILKGKTRKEIVRIKQAEEATLQKSLVSKITEAIYRTVEAKDLCELKQIEEDTQKHIQDYPDSKHVSALEIQINNKRKELEEENQADMEVVKKEIGNEWHTRNVHTVTSLFNKKHPCSKLSVELKKYAKSRVETINKIATKHKSILTGISEAQYLKLLVSIENNIDTFTQRYEDYPYMSELSDKLQEKRNELILREEQAFEYAKIDLEDTKMARDAHLIYEKFNESFPDSEHLITLEDLTRLKEAEIKISNAGSVEVANNILAEFIDILQLNEHKEILKGKTRKEIARIKQAEEAALQKSLVSKITEAINRTVEAKDLCELKQIEEDTQKYIQDYPDSKRVSALKIQTDIKRKELEEENQANLKTAKKEINTEWHKDDVFLVVSIFKRNYTCSNFIEKLNGYAKSRIETINKIETNYKSILTGISEAQDLELLVSIEDNIDTFTQRYEGYPYTSELSDKLLEKRNGLILREEQAFEYAKIDLEDTKIARDAHLVYEEFKESFPDSEYLVTLEDLANLKKAELKMSNATTAKDINAVLAKFIATLHSEEYKKALSDRVREEITRITKRPAGDTWIDPKTGLEFVYIPGGSFSMGDQFDEGNDDEKHIQKVNLNGFWMSKYEVSQGNYMMVMSTNPSHFTNGDQYPVEMVSWNDTQEFIQQLNALHQDMYTFRLPTDAEWEYACRDGGKKVRFGNGKDTIDPNDANFNGDARYKESYSTAGKYRKQTTPVGSFPPNNLGLHDMSGNVWEWTQDSQSTANNSTHTSMDNYRVIRGGSWNFRPRFLRATSRDYFLSDTKLYDCGFRIVRLARGPIVK